LYPSKGEGAADEVGFSVPDMIVQTQYIDFFVDSLPYIVIEK
jgi:hypothetical protein